MTPDDRWDDASPDPREGDLEAADAPWVERLRRLPRSIEPERDLWPAIAARLDEPRESAGPRRGALLAASLAAALIAFVAGRWSGGDPPLPAPEPAVAVAVAAASVPPNLVSASASLERTRRELERAFHARRTDLPPDILALVDENLASIGAAIEEIERALSLHPSDPQLGRRLVAYKTREIALLEQAQRAAARL